jgi:hypothetical protein
MNRMIITFFRRGFMFVLMATLTLSLSAQDKLPSEVFGPDGKPVEKATFYRVWQKRIHEDHEEQAWCLEQMDLADWKSGKRFEGMDPHHLFEYLVIESPGCALGIYQGGSNVLKLEKEFWVEGKVIDEAGMPVSDVDLTLGKIGLHTYTNVLLNPMAGKLPWVQTKTDKDGKYRFRGAVLDNYGWNVGVEVGARVTKNGKLMVGGGCLTFISDSPFFDEGRKQKNYFEGGGIIKILPCDEISGVVVDSLTGRPIEGATIKASGMFYHTGSFQSGIITTDKDGKFSISNVRCEMLGVMHDNYSRGNLIPSADWREKKHNKLEIKLAPLVNTKFQFIDTHTGNAPLVPLEFSYGVDAPAGDGWTLKIEEKNKCSAFFEQKSLKIGVDGVYAGKLPVGKFQFKCSMDREREESSPYSKSFELNIPSEGDRNFKVELDRKPGLLFSLNTVSSSALKQNDKWDYLTGHMKVTGSPYIHYVNLDKPIYFQPADKWNQEMNFQVILQKSGTYTNLMDRNFIATPDAWPVKIDAVAILGDLIRKDEK